MALHRKYVIIGAGPTGLGAALRLQEHNEKDWILLEADGAAGGLAASIVDQNGFTWDKGGHVIFSHYTYFDNLLDVLLLDNYSDRQREASVWLFNRFVPYPFQNNIWRLPEQTLIDSMNELLELYKHDSKTEVPENFREWIEANYGRTLADIFFLPYNRKVWAHEPDTLSTNWVGERVAKVNIKNIIANIVKQKDDIGWGPNARFRFPLRGGTGAIWHALTQLLPATNFKFNAIVERVLPQEKKLRLSYGEEITYDHLITTIPMDALLKSIELNDKALNEKLHERAEQLKFSSVHVIGVGFDEPTPQKMSQKYWMYFPENHIPFYRATVFSNYSKFNVPKPDQQWSLLCEVSESAIREVNNEKICDQVIQGLKDAQLITGNEKIATVWHTRLEHGYPTPYLGRDSLLDEVQPILMNWEIYSRGRFGGWKYEVANQDHSLMQGVELVDHLILGTEETTYFKPDIVNVGPKVPIRPIGK